ncbi:MAG: GTP 3',8-cyclase MoaA [Actinobacteria bacterium]|nr:GTP 3',8-cyclase MoaA [Actinomycetota bacterium]
MGLLVDPFGRKLNYLRISVTDRCNLRCIYCAPSRKIEWKRRDEILTLEEIIIIVRLFVEMGIKKVRLTGGEPMVRKNLKQLILQLSLMPEINTIAMTTNGVLLKNEAQALRALGVNRLNISLDTLRKERFERITLSDHYDDVLEGINAALEAGFTPLKLNVVMIAGVNDDEIIDFVEFIKDKPINVRFIEYMPFKFNKWDRNNYISCKKIRSQIEKIYNLIPIEENESTSGPAKNFQIDGFTGTVSFISPISEHFCGICNRIRLTAEGSIKSCLLSPAEVNLRSMLRKGIKEDEIKETICLAVSLKPKCHASVGTLTKIGNRAMTQIGG